MKIHFIAIGGSVMHNLALALHDKGEQVSGSDDEIFEPARGRLEKKGLLPQKEGWYPEKITAGLDAVILGMHAKADNPELKKAKTLGLNIYSFPEYLFHHAENKKRIVIGGSHGKTTITAMIMHVLKELQMDFDYMVGAQLEGFDVMVRLSEEAPLMIMEGDEYLTSALDPRPKFHLYKPHIAVISGIEWDHMNVFPSRENYFDQFRIFIRKIEKAGTLIYCGEDKRVRQLADEAGEQLQKIPYATPRHEIIKGQSFIISGKDKYPVRIFGRHNLMNLNAARHVCRQLGIKDEHFFIAISTFEGAAKRLELLGENENVSVFRDFAHAPSKLKASVEAVKSRNPGRDLVAVMELHTYSSLNKEFLPEYRGSMDQADIAVVFYNPHAFEIKKLPFLNKEFVKAGFGREDLIILHEGDELETFIKKLEWQNKNLLMMSSGDLGGIDLKKISAQILSK